MRVPEYPPDADGIVRTGLRTGVAIRGRGWFVLRDPATGDELFTRMGDFRLDADKYLVSATGLRVQGFNTPDTSATGSCGDVQIDCSFTPPDSSPDAYMTDFWFDTNGLIRVQMSDGRDFVRGQILLQDFAAPERLERVEYNVFAATLEADRRGDPAVPRTASLGRIESAALLIEMLPPQLAPLPSVTNSPASVIGVVTPTDNPTDLAIRGPGCFLVRDPVTSELSATRAGAFLVDSNNFLITYDRKRVQGFTNLPDPNVGDVRIAAPDAFPWWVDVDGFATAFGFDRRGVVHVCFSDGTESASQQVLLWNFARPEQLRPTALGQFRNVAAAQPDYITNSGGLGLHQSRIVSGLELINIPPDLLARRRSLLYFPQGAILRTHKPADLAIDGPGFFLLRHPRNEAQFVTRNGRFHFDHQGFLVNPRGLRVQGGSGPGQTNLCDVRIDWKWLPPGATTNMTITSYHFDRAGALIVQMSDGHAYRIGTVLLQCFREPYQLRNIGGGLYTNLAAAGPEPLAGPGSAGAGWVQSYALEQSPAPVQLTLPPRDGFRFSITGEPGSRWTIQATDDFASWHKVGVITNAAFESEFCDHTALGHPQRFYRVLAEYPDRPLNGLVRGSPIAVPVGPMPPALGRPIGFRVRDGSSHEPHHRYSR